MIKKIAALALIGSLAFAPAIAYAEDAAPAATMAKPMKPAPKKAKSHKSSTHKSSTHKSSKKKAAPKPAMTDAPKS